MGPIIAILIFLAIGIGYLYLMSTQGKLKTGEQLIYKEDNVKCTFKAVAAIRWATRNVEITNKRIIEKSSGLCLTSVTLNPTIKDKFGVINVLHADTTKISKDEKGQECLELNCSSGNITRHFKIRYYLKDFSQVKTWLGES